MFVVATDFDVIPYAIPNLTGNNSFPVYVNREEEKILKSLFGKTFYDSFIDALESTPEWVSTEATVIGKNYAYGNDVWEALTVQTGTAPVAGVNWALVEEDNKWLKLKNGADYVIIEKTYEWVGMKKLLIPYIFAMWLRDTFDNNSGIGVVVAKGENSKVINPGNRISRTFNEFSRLAGGCHEMKNTLYGFLKQEGTLGTFDETFDESFETFGAYLDFVWKDPGRMNTFQL